MQKYNSNIRIIVGVDHGYGNMKTAHRVFGQAWNAWRKSQSSVRIL